MPRPSSAAAASGWTPTRLRAGTAGAVGASLLGCVAISALSLLWPHTLTYDPWSWAIWGREIIHGTLFTGGGTSWKPLPVICDSLFSLFGSAAPDLWLIAARTGSLMALVFAYRLSARAAGPLAGVVAVAWLIFTSHAGFVFGWYTFFGSGWSEGLLAAFALGAIDAHVSQRPRAALLACFAAALIRPEAAIFVLLYGILALRRDPVLRRLALSLLVAVAVLWLLPDYLGSGQLLRGSSRALNDVPASIAHAAHPGLRDVALMRDLLAIPVVVGAVLAVLLARAGTRRLVLALLGVAIGWLAMIAIMTEAGYPGVPRFFAGAIAIICVVAGIGWGCLAGRVARGPLRLTAAAAVVILQLVLLAGHVSDLRRQTRQASYESRLNAQLTTVLARAGGAAAVRRCGPVSTNPLEVPAMSWQLGLQSRVRIGALRSGTIFRTTVFAQHRALPPEPSPRFGFRLVDRVGVWTVYARCGQ